MVIQDCPPELCRQCKRGHRQRHECRREPDVFAGEVKERIEIRNGSFEIGPNFADGEGQRPPPSLNNKKKRDGFAAGGNRESENWGPISPKIQSIGTKEVFCKTSGGGEGEKERGGDA